MREPMITVRSGGSRKYSAASAVSCEVARKRFLRQRLIPGVEPGVELDRREEVGDGVLVEPAVDAGGPDQREQPGHVGLVHVAEARA